MSKRTIAYLVAIAATVALPVCLAIFGGGCRDAEAAGGQDLREYGGRVERVLKDGSSFVDLQDALDNDPAATSTGTATYMSVACNPGSAMTGDCIDFSGVATSFNGVVLNVESDDSGSTLQTWSDGSVDVLTVKQTGGIAYVWDRQGAFPSLCNTRQVVLEDLAGAAEQVEIEEMIRRHYALTGSEVARRILADWHAELRRFVRVMPLDYRKVLEAAQGAASAEPALLEVVHG